MSNHQNRNTAKQALREILEMPWDPSICIGYSPEQVELMRKGHEFALNKAYSIACARGQIK